MLSVCAKARGNFQMVKLTLMLVGARHRITPATIREISAACPLKVSIEREPDNAHDENALAVICLEKPWKKMQFGYVSRQTAAEFSPRIDKQELEIYAAWLTELEDSGTGEMLVKARKLP